ncbi:hypothetical protein [Hymenobacter bucti]|uniref:Cation-transporting P-type ATPase C-terminal domain-containing protein n=1 Tax=Hymenobacter bucti TaxID=1844114 RepID=A0ABW4QTQ0_9BACT
MPAQSDNTVYRFRLNAWGIILIYQCLVMTLPALKLLHVPTVSSWSWLWITLPIWAPSALLALVLGAEQLARLGKAKADGQEHSLAMEPSAATY